jgi:hypothetical protein
LMTVSTACCNRSICSAALALVIPGIDCFEVSH